MTKTELISAVAMKAELTKKDSEKAVSAVFEAITEALVAGDPVSLVGFGKFEVKNRSEKMGPAARVPRRQGPQGCRCQVTENKSCKHSGQGVFPARFLL